MSSVPSTLRGPPYVFGDVPLRAEGDDREGKFFDERGVSSWVNVIEENVEKKMNVSDLVSSELMKIQVDTPVVLMKSEGLGPVEGTSDDDANASDTRKDIPMFSDEDFPPLPSAGRPGPSKKRATKTFFSSAPSKQARGGFLGGEKSSSEASEYPASSVASNSATETSREMPGSSDEVFLLQTAESTSAAGNPDKVPMSTFWDKEFIPRPVMEHSPLSEDSSGNSLFYTLSKGLEEYQTLLLGPDKDQCESPVPSNSRRGRVFDESREMKPQSPATLPQPSNSSSVHECHRTSIFRETPTATLSSIPSKHFLFEMSAIKPTAPLSSINQTKGLLMKKSAIVRPQSPPPPPPTVLPGASTKINFQDFYPGYIAVPPRNPKKFLPLIKIVAKSSQRTTNTEMNVSNRAGANFKMNSSIPKKAPQPLTCLQSNPPNYNVSWDADLTYVKAWVQALEGGQGQQNQDEPHPVLTAESQQYKFEGFQLNPTDQFTHPLQRPMASTSAQSSSCDHPVYNQASTSTPLLLPSVPRVPVTRDDVFAYAPEKIQRTFTECSFVIQLLNNQYNDAPRTNAQTNQRPFKALFVDPNGFEHKVTIKNVPMIRNSFYGLFYPTMPGVYKISVFIVNDPTPNRFSTNLPSPSSRDHVKGSPFTMKISKNYTLETRQVSIQIGEYGLEDSGSNPGRCWGLTTDHVSDNIFVTNREKHDVSVFSPLGTLMYKFGQDAHGGVENLFRPTGIVCDYFNRRLLIADKDHHRIAIYSLDGGFISSFGSYGHEDGQLAYPWDVDCTFNGDRIAVSDSKNHRIQIFDKLGSFVNKYTVFETNPFEYRKHLDNPRGISFDRDENNIFVTDFSQESVVRIKADCTESEKLPAPVRAFGRLQGLTVDPVGNILACDTRRNIVRVLKPDGTSVSSIGMLDDVPLFMPLNVSVMRGGNVAILDYDGRVRVF